MGPALVGSCLLGDQLRGEPRDCPSLLLAEQYSDGKVLTELTNKIPVTDEACSYVSAPLKALF